MNVNEVIAGRANEILTKKRGGKAPVHPNDHVNKSQSSNDCIPSAMHIAVAVDTSKRLKPSLDSLLAALKAKAEAWSGIVKIGRTHLQDAVPLTLGQEFSGYAHQIERCRTRIETAYGEDIIMLAQGGTAVGTGLNAPAGFDKAIVAEISRETGIEFKPAPNKFEALASHDPLVQFSGTLATLAAALNKIANDIRLLGSGPRCGLGELELPANEPGSSIMPGKVNPTQCEMLTMISAQVIGNHQAVTLGGAQGHLELNAFKPLIAANVLRSIGLLASGMESFASRCVQGLKPRERRISYLVDSSLMLVTGLVPTLGYENAARIAKHAYENDITLKQAAAELGMLDEAVFERFMDLGKMVLPHAKD
jgi:fumarate hydratase class II